MTHPRIENLQQEFEDCLSLFERDRIFSGPSVYFHYQTLAERARHPTLAAALQSDLLFDYLYATLASWGMHRMGRNNAKLCEMEVMRGSIRAQAPRLIALEKLTLADMPENQVDLVSARIWAIMEQIRVGIGGVKIVAGSKALHHLLPDLIPPVDREYTLQFFFGNKNINRPEKALFMEIFRGYFQIALQRKDAISKATRRGGEMNTSITKVIDNAIVGYVLKHIKGPRVELGGVPAGQNPVKNQPLQAGGQEPHAAQILRAAQALEAGGQTPFARNDIRLYLGLTPEEWLQGYTAIFQGMRIDHPGGAPQVGRQYRDVFRRIDRGLYQLTDAGKQAFAK